MQGSIFFPLLDLPFDEITAIIDCCTIAARLQMRRTCRELLKAVDGSRGVLSLHLRSQRHSDHHGFPWPGAQRAEEGSVVTEAAGASKFLFSATRMQLHDLEQVTRATQQI